ncbi:MAG TPA: phosphate-starvation-inducible PsiE family protein [Leptolyngbyaceae cyanobacterium]
MQQPLPLTNQQHNSERLWLNKNSLVRGLETIQDLFVICLCIGLFTLMAIQLRAMFFELLPPLDFKTVTSDILFLLILVELFRLLIIYLQEQRVSIGAAVEVSIVSVLRELIVRGVLETPWQELLSACVFLLVLGTLLIIRVWLPPTFNGIDPEKQIAMRHQRMAKKLASELPNNFSNLDYQSMTTILGEKNSKVRNEEETLKSDR